MIPRDLYRLGWITEVECLKREIRLREWAACVRMGLDPRGEVHSGECGRMAAHRAENDRAMVSNDLAKGMV